MPYVEYDEVEAVCADCGRPFRSEEALEEHRATVHAPAAAAAAPPGRRPRRATSPAPPTR